MGQEIYFVLKDFLDVFQGRGWDIIALVSVCTPKISRTCIYIHKYITMRAHALE